MIITPVMIFLSKSVIITFTRAAGAGPHPPLAEDTTTCRTREGRQQILHGHVRVTSSSGV